MNLPSKKFLEYFMDLADRTALLSSSQRLKVGAILVKGTRPILCCYNGTPDSYHTNVCEDEHNVTLPEVVHAEENIITKMAKSTESMEGCDLYLTHNPCRKCAVLLYQSGIKNVIFKNYYRTPDGIETLLKLGVNIIKYDEITF